MIINNPIGNLLEVAVPPGRIPEELLELPLDQKLDEVLSQLSPSVRAALVPVQEPLGCQLERFRELAEYTRICSIRLARYLPLAAFLDNHTRANLSLEALTCLGDKALFLTDYLNLLALLGDARDRRLPPELTLLAHEVAALRALLDQLRATIPKHNQKPHHMLTLLARHPMDPNDNARKLFGTFLERDDWRERDQVDLILEHLEKTALADSATSRSLKLLEDFQHKDHEVYEKVILGLISEARGCLGQLVLAKEILRVPSARGRRFIGPSRFRLLVESLAISLYVPPQEGGRLSAGLIQRPANELWQHLEKLAVRAAADREQQLDLKNYEMASLFLLVEAKPGDEGHQQFIQYLIENTFAYRRILATFYAPAEVQQDRLLREIDAFNRLPENSQHPVRYQEAEIPWLLKAIFLRPDVVQAIVHREQKKALYTVLPGLSNRAYLPRVLHEVHNIFGHVTPEVFSQIVATLDLDPSEVIRVIASYKEFTADPKGHILIYVCKGTACFLQGQPHISRALSGMLGAERGQISDQGIQYLEMDCFGVCHLAPVIKVGEMFLANLNDQEIPDIVAGLLRGVSYDNRLAFLNRIREMLPPGRTLSLASQLQVAQVHGLPAKVVGASISLSAAGEVFLATNGNGANRSSGFQGKGDPLLGSLVARSLSFDYQAYKGSQQVGSLVLDEAGQVSQVINYPDPLLGREIQKTIKPLPRVEDGQVVVRLNGGRLTLGEVNGNTVVVQRGDADFGSLTFAGEVCRVPPEEERGIPSRAKVSEPEDFVARQDRLLLSFAAGSVPDSIDSYEDAGGYRVLRRVLGLEDGRRWAPEEIIAEVSAAKLRGRGGAGFPAGRKWHALLQAESLGEDGDEVQIPLKLIVANGDEGDPGAFMDRTLVQERPHQLLEGMIIAALAVGARFGIIYLRKEYEDAVRRLENALFQARRRSYLGRNILGVEGVNFDIEIRLGAGAFVAGEKRAIMRAIEGKPAEPTLTAVSNIRRGLWGKPTLLNNVETFANVPLIIQKGGHWFCQQGHGASGGSKIFSAAGIVKQTGLVEVRFGRTLRDIIDICGGIKEGKTLAGVQIGGPSGAILSLTGIREYLLDAPLDFDTFNNVGAMLGSGGLVFLGEDDDIVRLARHFIDWLAEESCGQCPACLQGTVSLGETLDAVLQGEALSYDIHALWSKSDMVKAGSRCGLGSTASNPVTSGLRFFPCSFLHYVLGNNQVNRLELFRTLEALHLLSREDITMISRRRRVVVGHSFTLRKRFIPTLFRELQRIDRYRLPQEQRTTQFLHLLGLEEEEVGRRNVTQEYDLEELERHEQCMANLITRQVHSE